MSDTRIQGIRLGCGNVYLRVEQEGAAIWMYQHAVIDGAPRENLLGVCGTRAEAAHFLTVLRADLDALRFDVDYGGFTGDALESLCGEAPAAQRRRQEEAQKEAQEEAQTEGGESDG